MYSAFQDGSIEKSYTQLFPCAGFPAEDSVNQKRPVFSSYRMAARLKVSWLIFGHFLAEFRLVLSSCECVAESVGEGEIVVIPATYDKFVSPPSGSEDALPLNISFNLMEIREIYEVGGYFIIKWSFTRQWQDPRLTFRHLTSAGTTKEDIYQEKDNIWKPWLVFSNVKYRDKYYKTDKEDSLKAKFLKSSPGNISSGLDVSLEYSRELVAEWMCQYHMFWYPFDTQTCSVEMYLNGGNVRLVPVGLKYSGPRALAQYTVTDYQLCATVMEVNWGLSLEEG